MDASSGSLGRSSRSSPCSTSRPSGATPSRPGSRPCPPHRCRRPRPGGPPGRRCRRGDVLQRSRLPRPLAVGPQIPSCDGGRHRHAAIRCARPVRGEHPVGPDGQPRPGPGDRCPVHPRGPDRRLRERSRDGRAGHRRDRRLPDDDRRRRRRLLRPPSPSSPAPVGGRGVAKRARGRPSSEWTPSTSSGPRPVSSSRCATCTRRRTRCPTRR